MVLNLYRAMNREKIQFDFVIDHPNELELADEIESLGGRIYTMPRFNGMNFLQIRRAWEKFFVNHTEYRILHSHVRSYASLFLPVAKRHGVKTIIHSHSTSNGGGALAGIKKMLQYPLRYQADLFFSCSEQAGEWLFGKKVIESTHHMVLNNSIDAEKYRFNKKDREEMRNELELNGNMVYIHVGRFTTVKNHSFLLRVFHKIKEANPKSKLLLVGDGPMRERIAIQIEDTGLQNDVLLMGYHTDISKLLQAADVFLFPSLYEGLGIAAIEAQAAGLPCICSEHVPREAKIIDECLFAPLQEERWVEMLKKLDLSHSDTYQQIVDAGYDIHENAQWLESFYCKQWKEL